MNQTARIRRSIWLLATALVFTGCGTKPPTEQELARARQVSEVERPFGAKLWSVLEHDKSSNTLVSPFSVATNLSLLRNGIAGSSATDLSKVLGTDDVKLLNMGQKTTSQVLVSSGLATISNAIFAKPGIRFSPGFQQVAEDSYNATVEPLKDLQSAGVKQVNDWVSTHTNGRIGKIIDGFDDGEAVVLLNAITFDGLWERPFKTSATKSLPFSTLTGKVLTPQMHLQKSFPFSGHDGLKALELPYKGQEFSMLLMLPKSGKIPDDLVATIDPFLEVSRLQPEDTDVLLPKFKYSDSYSLKEPLIKIGLGQLFKACDFTPMAPGAGLAYVSRVIHKTYIEVDEKGTKAAAETLTGGHYLSAIVESVEPKQFHADRPFAFWILHKPTHTVLFFGTVEDPTKP